MNLHEIIEGEFKVVEPGDDERSSSHVEPLADGSWSVWLDDLPALVSIATSFIAAYLLKLFFF